MYHFWSFIIILFELGIVLLVAESGFPHLLCNSASLLASIANPTVLCLISGAVKLFYNAVHGILNSLSQKIIGAIFHYTIVGMYVFWTFHIGYFFYKVMFPFHANAHQSYKKYIHVTMAICGMTSAAFKFQMVIHVCIILFQVSWHLFLLSSLH